MGITKTDFMRGMQCPKMLWLDKHKPSERVIPPEVQARLDAGNDFGDKAMAMFGPYEEMTVLLPGRNLPDKKAMIAKTAEHIAAGTGVICEAAFSYYNNYCAVDILRKTVDGYSMYEVKNSLNISEQFVKDAGFQYYILSRCKIPVSGIFLVLNSGNADQPFATVDITSEAKTYTKWINDNIWNLNRMQKNREEPQIEPGLQCSRPYECWYHAYCHKNSY